MLNKLTKYLKIGGNSSAVTKPKITTKCNSTRQNEDSSMINKSNFIKQRRGNTMSSCSNNTSIDSRSKSKIICQPPGSIDRSEHSAKIIPKILSKASFASTNRIQTSNSTAQVTQNLETLRTCNSETSKERKYFSNKAFIKAQNAESAKSFDSKSSIGSSTLRTIQGLADLNKYVAPRISESIKKDLSANKDIDFCNKIVSNPNMQESAGQTENISENSIYNTGKISSEGKSIKQLKRYRNKVTPNSIQNSKTSYVVCSDKDSFNSVKCSRDSIAAKINETKKQKINRNLDSISNPANALEHLQNKSLASPNKRVNLNSCRKKPPLVKAGNSSNIGKTLRFPSNISSKRDNSYSVKTNSVSRQVVIPSNEGSLKSSSLNRVDKSSSKSQSGLVYNNKENAPSFASSKKLIIEGNSNSMSKLASNESQLLYHENVFQLLSPKLLNSKKKSIVSEISKYHNDAKLGIKGGCRTDKYTVQDFSINNENTSNTDSNQLKVCSKTPIHVRKKSRIGNFENKENFFVEPTEFHQIYGISKLNFDKCDFDESESNETCKNYGMFQQLQSSSNPNDISEKDMKTQNTQDYRKQTDLGIEEFDINFSGKKDLDRLIRYNLYNKPNDVEKHLDDIISCSVSYATNKRKEHSTKIHSRYEYPDQEEFEEEINELKLSSKIEDYMYPMKQTIHKLSSDDKNSSNKQSSMDSMTKKMKNAQEFLKGSNSSFLNPNSSFKNSVLDLNGECVNGEISCDNPLDMDSNRHSKQLNLEDLQVNQSFKDSFEENYEEEKIILENENEFSRNNQYIQSRDSNSLCNFKSLDVTNNSSSSIAIEDSYQFDEKRK